MLALLAVPLPPLAVLLRAGCGVQLFVNVLLWVLLWFPAVIHAWAVMLTYPDHHKRKRERDAAEERYARRDGDDTVYEKQHHHHHHSHYEDDY